MRYIKYWFKIDNEIVAEDIWATCHDETTEEEIEETLHDDFEVWMENNHYDKNDTKYSYGYEFVNKKEFDAMYQDLLADHIGC